MNYVSVKPSVLFSNELVLVKIEIIHHNFFFILYNSDKENDLPVNFYSTYHRMSSKYKKSSGLLDSNFMVKEQKRKMSDPDITTHSSDSCNRSQPIAIPSAAVSPIVSPHMEGK